MGKVLIIKGADFSQNAIERNSILVIEQGIVSLTPSNYGDYLGSSNPNFYMRLRALKTKLVYIEAGQECTITGLQGNGNVPAIRFDAAIYSSADNPSHDTCLHTLNGNTDKYYEFNTEGNDSYNFIAPYTGYYAFLFAGPTLQENVSPANYNIYIQIL